MFDVVILNGVVVDGTGKKAYRADVGVTGERIEAIGDLSAAGARRYVDASGLIVSPGFIDTHTHSEGDLLVNPQHACGLRQGITTECLGIDGMSYAPLSPANYRMYRRWLSGLLGYPPEDADMSSVSAFRANYHKKVSVNTAYLAPNGTLRLEAAGFRDVPLKGDLMKRYKKLLSESIEQGAVGFTTGSSYYPGPWSSTEELVEICKLVKEMGVVYMTEPRRPNPERAFGGGGVPEALEIARRSGVKLHFAHYRTNPGNSGRVGELMADIDAAKANGADITHDIYPYATGSSIPISFLPSEAQEGGPDAILPRLKDPSWRKRIVAELEALSQPRGNTPGSSGVYLSAAMRAIDQVVMSYLPKTPHMEGISLAIIAAERGVSLGEAMCDVMYENDLAMGYCVAPPMSYGLWRQVSKDSMDLLARDDFMVCSDITPAGSFPHPRSYGAFPRFLGRLRREFPTVTLEGMVHRMTDRPAQRFGIAKRGRIQKGYYADITIFDANRVIDTATFDDPRKHPVGIPYVLVNGQVAVDNDRVTGVLAGQAVP
ncbi:MAG: amidohydrolase family protein [SAR202 cluster bacterium]|nr:amidohydrolase family protein [SAR202 cluster bacterium]